MDKMGSPHPEAKKLIRRSQRLRFEGFNADGWTCVGRLHGAVARALTL